VTIRRRIRHTTTRCARARDRGARRARARSRCASPSSRRARSSARASTRADRVGAKDFARARVGDVWRCVALRDARALCASRDAMASIDLARGAIEWRVASEAAIETFDVDATRGVATTTSGAARARGKTVRAYDVGDGAGEMLWEDVSYGDAHESERAMREAAVYARDAPDATTGDGTTTTLARGEVVMRQTMTGRMVWRANVRDALDGRGVGASVRGDDARDGVRGGARERRRRAVRGGDSRRGRLDHRRQVRGFEARRRRGRVHDRQR
jgi:hypothetical protein